MAASSLFGTLIRQNITILIARILYVHVCIIEHRVTYNNRRVIDCCCVCMCVLQFYYACARASRIEAALTSKSTDNGVKFKSVFRAESTKKKISAAQCRPPLLHLELGIQPVSGRHNYKCTLYMICKKLWWVKRGDAQTTLIFCTFPIIYTTIHHTIVGEMYKRNI